MMKDIALGILSNICTSILKHGINKGIDIPVVKEILVKNGMENYKDKFSQVFILALIEFKQKNDNNVPEFLIDEDVMTTIKQFTLGNIKRDVFIQEIRRLIDSLAIGDRLKANNVDVNQGVDEFMDIYNKIVLDNLSPSLNEIYKEIGFTLINMKNNIQAEYQLLRENQDNIMSGIGEVKELIKESDLSLDSTKKDNVDFLNIAKKLLDVFKPTELASKFLSIDPKVQIAIDVLKKIERYVCELSANDNDLKMLSELLDFDQKYHLILGVGGAGKSYALWKLGNTILRKRSDLIPILISLRNFSSLKELNLFLNQVCEGITLEKITESYNVIFLLDGWTEFVSSCDTKNQNDDKLILAAVEKFRIIATGRHHGTDNSNFKIWNLKELNNEDVESFLRKTNFESVEEFTNILRYPLMLILYVLLGGKSTTKSDLFYELYKHLTLGVKSRFKLFDLLCIAASDCEIRNDDKKWSVLEKTFERLADEKEIEYSDFLFKCGLTKKSDGLIEPIHDLYWDWLVGNGILIDWERKGKKSIEKFRLRECVKLVLSNDNCPTEKHLISLINFDATSLALFVPYLNNENVKSTFANHILNLLKSESPFDWLRAINSSFLSKNIGLVNECYNQTLRLINQKFLFDSIDESIDNEFLWLNKDQFIKWIDAEVPIHPILRNIQEAYDIKWAKWIESEYLKGNVSFSAAFNIYLSNCNNFPYWIKQGMIDYLVKNGVYQLRVAINHGENVDLATWVLDNYDYLIESTSSGSTPFELNRVIVKCGDNNLINTVVKNFSTFSRKAQEYLLYAIEGMGDSYLQKLQTQFLHQGISEINHILLKHVCDGIEESVCRSWIINENNDVKTHGWKCLLNLNKSEAIDELIDSLPESFNDIHYIPEIKALASTDNLPDRIVDTIFPKIESTMQPMAMQDIIYAISNVKPYGIISIYKNILQSNPRALPTYHLMIFLKCLDEWQVETGMKLMVNRNGDESVSLIDYLLILNINRDQMEFFINKHYERLFSSSYVRKHLIQYFCANKEKYLNNCSRIRLPFFSIELFDLVMEFKEPKECFETFKDNIAEFSGSNLKALFLSIQNTGDKDLENTFLYYVSEKSNSTHKECHKDLIDIYIKKELSYFQYNYLAKILFNYPIYEIKNWLEPYMDEYSMIIIGILKKIEILNGASLINESGSFLN